MQRLSGLDASFLYLETRSQLMHVIGLFEIDPSTMPGGYRFDKLRAEMERRIAAIPAFRRKLDNSLFNIDHPVWIEDEEPGTLTWEIEPSAHGAVRLTLTHDLTGHHLPQIWGLVVAALEEGVEMSLPLLFIVALVQYQRRATSAPTAYSTPAFDRR